MKRFIGFIKKEFYHIFRDKRTLLILFGMPIAQIMLFGFAITNEIKDVKIAVLDKSKDNVTEEIRNKILSSGYFKLYDNLNTDAELDAAFKKGEIKEAIIFQPNFAEDLTSQKKASVQLIADATDPNLASLVVGYTTSILMDYQSSLAIKPPPLITTEVKNIYNPELKSVYMFVPGLIAVILLLVSALMTSISITREKELGTMEVILVSPLHPIQIIIGKVVPYFMLAFTNTCIILLLAKFVFEVPIEGSLVFLLIECVIFMITALSLGILISTVSDNQQTAMMLSLSTLMLPTIMLSGFVFPIDNMPLVLQILSNIIPAKWFLIIVRGIMLKGATIQYLWQESLVLGGMALFYLVVSLKKFKIRLQ
ncbi:MAG: ABC transporter permease [Ignavibacteriae bacterium]|nr:ABC transporter permease [Ignavibacteriota bacterium]MCB9244228.1 ABC transporter permease [Ignavibacteriales bacterium]